MSSSEIDDILSRALDLGVEELFYDSTDEIKNIPEPPPLPCIQPSRRKPSSSSSSHLVPKEVIETWDKLFKEAYGANVIIETNNNTGLLAHSSVLTAASPVIATLLNQSWDKNGNSYIKIIGVPCEAAYMFIRFLYSSCYEEEEMKKYVLHLLVLSHCYSVPSLKRVCVEFLDQGWINTENVIDVLQLARNCDAPRISLKCVSMIIKEFKSVSSTEGWKVMKQANPELEKELVEITVESEARKQERRRKLKERKVYLQVYEVMEALVHICRDGCKTIGPRDKELRGRECKFPACKGLEDVLRHFLGCTSRDSCVRCKRMWQLLQLHSCLCDDDDDSCSVPLCGHFKEKMKEMSKRAKSRWRLLVEKIITVKKSLGPFSSRSFGLI